MQEQGNEDFKRGLQLKKKYFLQQALVKYSEGLKVPGLPQGFVMSTILSNRAQVHLRLMNNRSALEDALSALKADDSNVKVRYDTAFPHSSPPSLCFPLSSLPPIS